MTFSSPGTKIANDWARVVFPRWGFNAKRKTPLWWHYKGEEKFCYCTQEKEGTAKGNLRTSTVYFLETQIDANLPPDVLRTSIAHVRPE